MTDYTRVRLRSMPPPGWVSHANAAGLKPMRALAALQPGLGQDRLAASSRRILLQGGLRGAVGWMVSVNSDTAGPHNPDHGTPYSVAGIVTHNLNPGCVLALRVLSWPAGYVQEDDNADSTYTQDGARGAVQVDLDWTSGISGSQSTVHTVEMAASTQSDSGGVGEPPSGYGNWSGIEVQTIYMTPTGWSVDDTVTRAYSAPGSTVGIEVSYIGSPRVIYWCVYEVPHEIVAQLSDSQGAWGGMTDADGAPLKGIGSEYPITRVSASNPYKGSLALLEGVDQFYAGTYGGGFHWRAGAEDQDAVSDVVSYSTGTGSDEIPPLPITSTTFVNILKAGDTAWTATSPGWDVSSMAYCAGYDATQIDGTRAVMAKVQVRWKVSAGTGTVRVRTAPHSYVDLTTTSTSETTTTAVFRFDVGNSPWDQVIAQVLAKQSSGTMSLYEVTVTPMPPSS